MSFRKNLAYLRKEAKMSQEDLAFKLDVSRQSVSKWESGGAYPETDKMLKMCKIFDCSLDELMNQDIEQIRKDEDRAYSFKDILNEIRDLLERTIEMLTSMKFKGLVRFLFEVALLFVLILIIRIPFGYIEDLGTNMFMGWGAEYSGIVISTWKFLVEAMYVIIAAIIFVYTYKIYFLDKFEEKHKLSDRKNRELDTKNLEESEARNEVKGKNKREESVDFGIFSIFVKLFVFLIKVSLVFAALFILFFLIGAVAVFIINLTWLFQGIFFMSIFILTLALSLLFVVCLQVIYNFILNRKSDWDKIFKYFIISVLALGIGVGVFVLDFSKLTFVDSISEHAVENTVLEIYPMDEDLTFPNLPNLYYYPAYIVDDSLDDNIRIEVTYYSDFLDMSIEEEEVGVVVVHKKSMLPVSGLYSLILKDLKDNMVTDYHSLFNYDVKIYGNEENINKLIEESDF